MLASLNDEHLSMACFVRLARVRVGVGVGRRVGARVRVRFN